MAGKTHRNHLSASYIPYGLHLDMLSRKGLFNPVSASLTDCEYVFSWLRVETFIGQDGVGRKRLQMKHSH